MNKSLSEYLICDAPDALYDESFQCPIDLPYKIDVFQQQAAKAIHSEHNVLLSCATGSGKTVPCLFAIHYYLKKNKRVVYTSPVKSLSNQKFKEFSEKIPDVGIMTGDIKCNPDAQCVIMTTEILRNMLYKDKATTTATTTTATTTTATTTTATTTTATTTTATTTAATTAATTTTATTTTATTTATTTTATTLNSSSNNYFDTVECVIFDEIHYINDKDRGKIWEESIIMLPPHIKILGCSGTISEPEKFASWIGDIKKIPIHLIKTLKRPIPLNHYVYVDNIDNISNIDNIVSDDKDDKDSKKGMIQIMKEDTFLSKNYSFVYDVYQKKCVDPLTKKVTAKAKNMKYAKSQSPYNLNTFIDFLKKNRYLPSLIFVLSRQRVEEYAAAIQVSLIDHDAKSQIGKVFDSCLSKFGNQYKKLNQYNQVRDLLLRGIGIHHSGLIPVLKEAVEILFSKNLIKVLFATETFAIGVNMPTKTVVFTEFVKPDANNDDKINNINNTRILKTDEYLQMSGRAGRRGLDSTGTIIIFPIKELPNLNEMKTMMTGSVTSINSKFCPGYQFILKCLANEKDLWNILGNSLKKRQDKVIEESLTKEKEVRIADYDRLKLLIKEKYGEDILELAKTYNKLYQETLPRMIGSMVLKPVKDKNIDNQLTELSKKVTKTCYKEYLQLLELEELIKIKDDKASSGEDLDPIFNFLSYLGYLITDVNNEWNNTVKGIIASEINDANCILLTEMITENCFDTLSGPEMLGLLAIFIEEPDKNSGLSYEEKKYNLPPNLKDAIDKVFDIRDYLEELEEKKVLNYNISLDTNWSIYLDFVEIAYLWGNNASIHEIYEISNIYEGNLVKNMLRLQNMAENIIEIFKLHEKHDLANKLEETSKSIIRDIVTNNSLYV